MLEAFKAPWVLVLAGGSGRRLEPVTRALHGEPVPKQYCRLPGRPSLLQETLDRLAPVAPPERTVIVVDRGCLALALREVAGQGYQLLGQPLDRGTGPGVLFPLTHILLSDPDALVVISPSDHAIGEASVFRAAIENSIRAVAADPGRIVLFGVEADAPRTDYGWIVAGASLHAGSGNGLRPVLRFVEKPADDLAGILYRSGALWNTLVMVARARVLRGLFRRRLPRIARFFRAYARVPENLRPSWLEERYASLERADFSADLLSSARNLSVYVCPRSMAWSDVGTPERLFSWLQATGHLQEMVSELRERGAGELASVGLGHAMA